MILAALMTRERVFSDTLAPGENVRLTADCETFANRATSPEVTLFFAIFCPALELPIANLYQTLQCLLAIFLPDKRTLWREKWPADPALRADRAGQVDCFQRADLMRARAAAHS